MGGMKTTNDYWTCSFIVNIFDCWWSLATTSNCTCSFASSCWFAMLGAYTCSFALVRSFVTHGTCICSFVAYVQGNTSAYKMPVVVTFYWHCLNFWGVHILQKWSKSTKIITREVKKKTTWSKQKHKKENTKIKAREIVREHLDQSKNTRGRALRLNQEKHEESTKRKIIGSKKKK